MAESLRIDDFVPAYPEQNHPYIQSIVAHKKEFAELAALPVEPIPKRGQFYRHQKLFMRYLRQYDRCLNFRETGTGKSCDLIALVEFLKENPTYKKAFILERGDATKDEFRNQIVCRCTPEGEYDTKGKTHKGVNDAVNKVYHLDTYTKFANKYGEESKITDEQIDAQLSGCIFLIDEAHNLRNIDEIKSMDEGKKAHEGSRRSQGLDAKGLTLSDTYRRLKRIFRVAKRTKIIISTATPMINSVNDVVPLINLLLPEDKQLPVDFDYTKVTLNEIEYYVRGMITFVRGLDTGVDIDYRGEIQPMEKVYQVVDETKFRPPPNTGLDLKTAASQRPTKSVVINSTTPIYASKMVENGLQRIKYLQSISKLKETGEAKKIQPFKISQRQASAFVFPVIRDNRIVDGSYGVKAGNEYINVTGGLVSAKMDSGKLDFMAYLASPKFLSESGIKIASIMDIECPLVYSSDESEMKAYGRFKTGDAKLVRESYNLNYTGTKYFDENNNGYTETNYRSPVQGDNKNVKRQFARTRGSSFIYSEYVRGGGAYLIGLAFMARGYTQYKEEVSLEEKTTIGSTSYCLELGTVSVQKNFPKKARFAIITSETSVSEFRNILNLFNSRENINGEYLQVIIGSEVARDGINLYDVLRGHIFSPPWNRSGMHQALSRFIRATSHDYLIEELKKILGPNARARVNIFLHAAVPDDEITNSVDINMYKIGEDKDFPIHHLFRYLKKCAFDCDINKARNIRSTDINGSAVCDYDTCAYTSFFDDTYGSSSIGSGSSSSVTSSYSTSYVNTSTQLDTSTYDILYVDELLDNCANDIVEILKIHGGTNLDELYSSLLEKYGKKKYIHMALSKIISSRKIYLNSFGYMCYIISDGFNVYFQREYPQVLGKERQLDYPNYGNKIVSIVPSPYIDYIYREIVSNYYAYFDKKLQAIQDITPKTAANIEFAKTWDRVPLPIKIEMIENCLYKKAIIKAKGSAEGTQKTQLISKVATRETEIKSSPKGLASLNIPIPTLSPIDETIIRHMQAYWYAIPEPTESLIEIKEIIADRSRTKKLKPSEIENIVPGNPGSTDIYVHILHSMIKDDTSYGIASKAGRAGRIIRLLNPNETLGWRNAEKHEYYVYEHLIELEFKRLRERFEQYDYYGSILSDGKFRVVEKSQTDKTNYGRVCYEDDAPTIIEEYINVCHSLKIIPPIPGGEKISIPLNANQTPNMEAIMKRLDDERISKYVVKTNDEKSPDENIAAYKLLQIGRSDVCIFLQTLLNDNGRLLIA